MGGGGGVWWSIPSQQSKLNRNVKIELKKNVWLVYLVLPIGRSARLWLLFFMK